MENLNNSNNEEDLKKSGGREIHKYLISSCFKLFNDKGYKVEIEKILPNNKQADLFVSNGSTFIIECLVRPTLTLVKHKKEIYADQAEHLIICYPSNRTLNFPIDDLVATIKIDVPEEIIKKNLKEKVIRVSEGLYNYLCKSRSIECKTFESVLWRFIRDESGEVEGLKPSPPNNQNTRKEVK